jgi:hypothetical protein
VVAAAVVVVVVANSAVEKDVDVVDNVDVARPVVEGVVDVVVSLDPTSPTPRPSRLWVPRLGVLRHYMKVLTHEY